MKKNWTMRVGALMLALTLITSCFVGGTFAKYVTAGEGSDYARVAKFGVVVENTGSAFNETYAKDDNSFTLAANTVVSTDKVVAPGTKGSMAAFTITGTPEVAVRVAVEAATVDFGDNWVDADGAYYCPIDITVGETTYEGLGYSSIETFEAAVKAAIEAYTADYEAGTDLSTITDDAPVISWAWTFSTGAENDVKDTFLGDWEIDGRDAADITIGTNVTVTQID